MARVKGGIISHKRRTNVLKNVKGFLWGRKSKERLAKDALRHAWEHAYKDRKRKKREFRGLWQTKIGAATREAGMSYSAFMSLVKKQGIALDRKILSQMAESYPELFKNVLEKVKG